MKAVQAWLIYAVNGMSQSAFYKWRSKYAGMDSSMLSELKRLQQEN